MILIDKRHSFVLTALMLFTAIAGASPDHALGQAMPAIETPATQRAQTTVAPVPLSLDEAVQIALANNYALQSSRLDIENAQAQVREAWGQVLPQVTADASYTRNLKSANPFAGSDAGGLFGSLGSIGWLAYNEDARSDNDPATVPLSLDEFRRREADGYSDAGIVLSSSDNPFAVPNQFQGGISVSQTLFNGSAFAAIKGAEALQNVNRLGADWQAQQVVDQTHQAYYAALLAQEQSAVMLASVSRTQETVLETAHLVSNGVVPKYQRLSAEVELGNLQTQLIQAQSQAATSLDNLKMTLGIPIAQPIRLSGTLEIDDNFLLTTMAAENAIVEALSRRPDLAQARTAVELQQIQKKTTRSGHLPTVSAFANFSYTGSVPETRTSVLSNPNDPFSFSQRTNSFFSDNYWNPAINAGVRLSWSIFNGGQTRARIQQQQIAVEKAQVQYEQLEASVSLEVERSLRNLQAARQQIMSQTQNADRAEMNYDFTDRRLREGVSSQMELREASQQLDQSRLSYTQAVHDYLVARSAFEAAIGAPSDKTSNNFNLTSH